jgi:hypothetical protein
MVSSDRDYSEIACSRDARWSGAFRPLLRLLACGALAGSIAASRAALSSAIEAGAAAASTSKSGFGGSLLTNIELCPQVQADDKLQS